MEFSKVFDTPTKYFIERGNEDEKLIKEQSYAKRTNCKSSRVYKTSFCPWNSFLLLMFLGIFTQESAQDKLILIFGGLVIGLILSIPAIKNSIFNELAITNKKVYGKIGFIKTVEMNSPIHQIQNVRVSNGLLGKIFKYGTINITTTTGVYYFKCVKNPNDFKNAVMAQIAQSEESKMDLHAQKTADAIKQSNN